MKVSVVVPVYNEEGNLPALLPRLLAALDGCGHAYEVLFVDDGSRDGSLAILKDWARRRPDCIRVLELSHNFGQHQAILAAFRDVTGDVVVTLDADLQNPPEEIPKLLAKVAEGYDVVGGVRQGRQDSAFRRVASALVNRVTVAITRIRLTDFGCMLRAYAATSSTRSTNATRPRPSFRRSARASRAGRRRSRSRTRRGGPAARPTPSTG